MSNRMPYCENCGTIKDVYLYDGMGYKCLPCLDSAYSQSRNVEEMPDWEKRRKGKERDKNRRERKLRNQRDRHAQKEVESEE